MEKPEIPSSNALVEVSKHSTPSRNCLYNRVPHPNQVPNFQFEETPTAIVFVEEGIHGHFVEPSWPTLILESNLKDFSEAD